MKGDKEEPTPAARGIQEPGTKRNLSRSATRALDVLEYFAMVGRPVRAVDVAQALDLHTSSTDQLLKTMVDSAYLMFDADNKQYYPSPRLVNFGSWLAAGYFGEDRICQLMQTVQRESGETITLSIRCGTSMQIVDYIEPIASAGRIIKGSRVSITNSVIGTAFLALHTNKDVIRIVEQVTQETGNKPSVSELKDLLKTLEEARSNGYVCGPAIGGEAPWVMAIALPSPSSGIKLVLGLTGEKNAVLSREAKLLRVFKESIHFWLKT